MAQRRTQLVIIALFASSMAAGCAVLPGAGEPDPERTQDLPVSGDEHREQVMNPASASLLEQAADQRRSGNVGQAGATLERAVRIDPAEPAVWLELARLRYEESNWDQAEQLARKARSLAAAGSPVRADATGLVADALDRQGRQAEARRLRNQE